MNGRWRWRALAVMSGGAAASVGACASRAPDVPAPLASDSAAAAPAKSLTFEAITWAPVEGASSPTIDGDLAEWATRRTPVLDHLAVWVTKGGAYFVGELDLDYAGGVALSIGAEVAVLPDIGLPTRGGGHQPLDCVHELDAAEGGYVVTERPLEPEIAAKCREFVAAFAKQKAAHEARFVRSFVIDESGVAAIDAEGRRGALAGAKAGWKRTPVGTVSLEVFLPPSGLPRLGAAQIDFLRVRGEPASTASSRPGPGVPAIPNDMTPNILLPEGVAFEPYASLRTYLFGQYPGPQLVGEDFVEHTGLSYAPGDPEHVEWWRHEGSGETIAAHTGSLYEQEAKVGDVEVGRTNAYLEYVTVKKGGEIVDVRPPPAPVQKILARDGEIHVISYDPGGWGMMQGSRWSQWIVQIVDPNGGVRDGFEKDTFAEARDAYHCEFMMSDVGGGTATHSESWDRLDWSGYCPVDPGSPSRTEAGYRVRLKWDPMKKLYVGDHAKIAAPKAGAK